MKFAVAKEQRDFYQKHQVVEIEALLTPTQLAEWRTAASTVISQRFAAPAEKVWKIQPSRLFEEGRDLWRENEILRKMETRGKLVEIAADLVQIKPLRMGFDQLFPSTTKFSAAGNDLYYQFLQRDLSLEKFSSFSGLACCLMLCLEKGEKSDQNDERIKHTISILPSIPGNGIFFKPSAPINFFQLNAETSSLYLMIVFVKATSLYVAQAGDPLNHLFKKIGYAFGDKLSDKLNPIIYR